jgi:large subunit ribosomal protein L9
MKVILLENVKGVGKKDDIINANDGYARNYLLPKKLAVEANAKNLANLKSKQSSNAFRRNEDKKKAEEIKEKIEKIFLKIEVKAGENGKIFGGVTSKEISDELKKQYNIEVDKKKIELKETIKTIGVFDINIKLFEGVNANLKLTIVGK